MGAGFPERDVVPTYPLAIGAAVGHRYSSCICDIPQSPRTARRTPIGDWFAPYASAARYGKRQSAQLGELDARGRVRARALAKAIVGVERQPGLFDDELPQEPISVDLRRFRLERGRRFGDVWLGWRLWQALGLEQLLEQLLPVEREEVPWRAHGSRSGHCSTV